MTVPVTVSNNIGAFYSFGGITGATMTNTPSLTWAGGSTSTITVTYPSTTTTWVGPSGGGSSVQFPGWSVADHGNAPDFLTLPKKDGEAELPDGFAITIRMRDGSKLVVDAQGNYRIEDTDAKVTYKANRVLEFNPYLNASDLLARFIRSLRDVGVWREDVPTLPLALFVNWLILEAAEQDGIPAPADTVQPERHRLLTARVKPRCVVCHRFIRRAIAAQGFVYCTPDHAARHYARLAAA